MRFVSIIVSFFLFTTLYAEQDLFVGEKIGYQESNPKAPDTLHYLEVEKAEDTYILRGVMTFSNNRAPTS